MNCPDCGMEIKEIVVERFQTKTFVVNHGKEEITSNSPSEPWDDADDYAYHCSNCDSLNVDSMLKEYSLLE